MTKNEEDVLFYAFRYALGRRTSVVSFMVDQIKNHWHELRPKTQDQIQHEIKLYPQMLYTLGDKCDIDNWQEVLDLKPDEDV